MGYSRNIGHNLLSQVLRIIFGILTSVIVARALGPDGQGYIAYLILIFNLLGTFGHFGIVSAVTYFQKRSDYERSIIYSSNFNYMILICLALSALIIFLRYTGIFLSGYPILLVGGGLLLMSSTMLTNHAQSWLIGDEEIIRNNNTGLIVFFLKSGAIVLLWILGILAIGNYFWITVIAMLLWYLLLQRNIKEKLQAVVSTTVLKAELSYGLIGWLAALFAYLHYRADQVMIKHLIGDAELGVYTIAVLIAELLFLLPLSINTALTGRLYNLEGEETGKALLYRTIRTGFWICFCLMLIGLAGSLLIPAVYGKSYSGAVAVTMILLPGVLFASIPKLASPWFFSSGRPGIPMRITMVTLLVNIVLNYFFIPIYGIRGAAVASTISYLAYGLIYLFVLSSKESFSLKALILPDRTDFAILKSLLKR